MRAESSAASSRRCSRPTSRMNGLKVLLFKTRHSSTSVLRCPPVCSFQLSTTSSPEVDGLEYASHFSSPSSPHFLWGRSRCLFELLRSRSESKVIYISVRSTLTRERVTSRVRKAPQNCRDAAMAGAKTHSGSISLAHIREWLQFVSCRSYRLITDLSYVSTNLCPLGRQDSSSVSPD